MNSSGTVLETRDYYPFGLEMPGRSYLSGTKAKENYTGHERDAESGMLYAGARFYMPNIGRWTSVDPLAASYPAWSPYNYVLNNPLGLVDPDGKAPVCPSCDIRIDSRVKQYLSGGISRDQFVEETTLGLNQVTGATGDFVQNYRHMREANTIGADKYFHCNANCEATQRGEHGEVMATLLSNFRELFDRLVKGDPLEASDADQEANRHGRENASTGECGDVCEAFRPGALYPERNEEEEQR